MDAPTRIGRAEKSYGNSSLEPRGFELSNTDEKRDYSPYYL